MEKWILDEKIVSDRNLKPHLHYINKRINFLKTMKYINEGKKVESALHLEAAMLLYDKVHPIMVQERLNAFLERKDRFTDED